MNAPQDYDDDAERLRTHPLLLPEQEEETEEMSTEDKNVLKKTTNNISFSTSVKFTEQFQRTLLRSKVTRRRKQGTEEGKPDFEQIDLTENSEALDSYREQILKELGED